MHLTTIISGGQNGVDISALRVAKAFGLLTGGWMTSDWKTLDGPRPWYEHLYAMRAAPGPDYKLRTGLNVQWSDATLRIAGDFNSRGEICTKNWIDKHRRNFFDVPVGDGMRHVQDWAGRTAGWIIQNKIVTLNVAGNSEYTYKGIEAYSEHFIVEVLLRLRQYS